jgi:hypothetical protein
VVNGACRCEDFPNAPRGWCQHRIAAGLVKRAAPANGHEELASQPPAAPPLAVSAPLLLEAPASVNRHITLG